MLNIDGFGALLEVDVSKKCAPLWREAHFEVKTEKTEGHRALLDARMSFCVAGTRGSAPCQKRAKREGFVAFPKTGVGDLQRICKDAFRVASAVPETCSSEMLGGQGPDFLRGVAFLSIRSSGLISLICGRRNTLDSGKIAKRIGTRPSALHSTVNF